MPQLIAREEAKDQILEYIRGALSQDDYYWESGSNINKCAVLTTAGIKGTGKTRVLHEMCTTWRDETGAKAAVTVDFNGGAIGTTAKLQPKCFQSYSFSSQACLRRKQKTVRPFFHSSR